MSILDKISNVQTSIDLFQVLKLPKFDFLIISPSFRFVKPNIRYNLLAKIFYKIYYNYLRNLLQLSKKIITIIQKDYYNYLEILPKLLRKFSVII